MEDQRFKHVMTDPKFRRIPKKDQKIKIDKRFQSMFKDKNFKVKYSTDKRGRPVNRTSTEDLKRYYELSSEDESSDSEDETEKQDEAEVESSDKDDSPEQEVTEESVEKPKKKKSELKQKHKSDKALPDDIKKKLKNLNVDYARGEAVLYSESSSDDDESEEEVSEDEEIDHKWGELHLDAEQTEEATSRLAACNMDWDRIRAVDLMVLFNSFLPGKGFIKSVVIYPSDFGKQRMKEEEIKGPVELVQSKVSDDEDEGIENENEEGSGYHMEKLRQYQLNRLKYYYAVITFDSVSSANKIYTECDGMEYESSAIKLDLRFIPEDMEFDDEPKEACDKLPELNKYEPRFFTTTALQQAKVNLTWDETNPDRIEMTEKLNSGKVDNISEADLQNYLASSSEEENDETEAKINDSEEESDELKGKSAIDKYRALLQDIEQKESAKKNDVEMEISWGIDLKEKTEKLSKARAESAEQTPFQQYLEKRKAKRKEKRKQKLDQKNKDSDDDDESDSDVPSDVDMNDPYFAEEFRNAEFKKKKKSKKPVAKDGEETEKKNAALELLLMNEEDDNKKHFSLKHIQEVENESKSKKKRKNKKNKEVEDKKGDDFEIDTKDQRFSALFTSHHFNIDPTDPHYKKTKGMERLIDEKLKRRHEDKGEEEVADKKAKTNKSKAELSLLVKSVKRKANSFKNK